MSNPEGMTRDSKSLSINLRLLGASLVILPLFLGTTALVLDRAFAGYQSDAQRESMRLQELLLARAIEWDGSRWQVLDLDELRFNAPRSGLYAFLLSTEGDLLWQSPSSTLLGDAETIGPTLAEATRALDVPDIGSSRFGECSLVDTYFCHATRIAWGSKGPESLVLVLESRDRVMAARDNYRGWLLGLSLLTALLLVLAQSLIFRWGLAPLRKIAAAIGLLERGESDRLGDDYPDELQPLTRNINTLLASERRRREQVRNTMDRLTHVLKTPLMIIRNSRDEDTAFRELAQDQVDRMLEIVEGELAKARLDGRGADILGKPVAVKPVLQRICDAYSRLPPRNAAEGGSVTIDANAVDSGAVFHGEERDLQDLFGSLLENSMKYCRSRIEVSALERSEAGESQLEITVEDDGDGIPEGLEQEILQRGARADSANVGQGLGLSIVVEIISAYGGSLHTGRSNLGGALFIARFPVSPGR